MQRVSGTPDWHAAVIIPTRGHPDLVTETLESVAGAVRAIPDSARCDVVVVDDSPVDEAEVIAKKCAEIGARYLYGPRTVAVKRNVGARATAAAYLIFLDSDCTRVVTGFVTAHVDRLRIRYCGGGRRVGAVAGPVFIRGDDSDTGSALWRMASRSFSFQPQFQWPRWYGEVFWAATANLSLTRDIFDGIGRFHEQTFTVVGGEDVDLCMRLQDAGYALVTAPAAVAYHATAHIRSVAQLCRKMFTYGRSEVYSAMRQPHHQQAHVNPTTVVLLLAASAAPRGWRAVLRRGAVSAATVWAAHAVTLMARNQSPDVRDAVRGVAMDWAFDFGTTVEALRRGVPRFAFQKFRYLDQTHFRPHPPTGKEHAR